MADFNIQVGAKVTDNIQKQLNGFTPKTVTVKPILDTKGIQTGTKTVTDLVGAQGEMIKTTEKLSLATGKSNTTISQYKKNYKDASQAVEENSKAMKTNATSMAKTTDSSKKLGQSMLDIATKVAKFYVITKAIQTVQRAMGEAVEVIKNVDSAMTDFAKVSDLSGESLQKYYEQLSNLGKSVYRSGSEMMEGATLFKQAGYTEEQSANLAKVGALFQNISDAQIDASQSASVIISQLKAFNMTSNEAIHVIDAINQSSNEYAVTSSDLSTGLTAAGSALSTYGNSFEETVGLITAG